MTGLKLRAVKNLPSYEWLIFPLCLYDSDDCSYQTNNRKQQACKD